MQRRAVLHARDADIARDLGCAAEVLDVVVGHRRAFGVADDVDLVRPGAASTRSTNAESSPALCSIGVQPTELVERGDAPGVTP